MHTHYTIRAIRAGGGVRIPAGRVVDASNWRNLRHLVERDMVRPLPPHAEPVQDTEGNWWMPNSVPGKAVVGKAKKGGGHYPEHQGFGRWLLSDGSTFKGNKEAAFAAEAEVA